MLERLILQIATMRGCSVYPPKGLPKTIAPLPDDLREFYTICGGIVLFEDSMYPLLISSPEKFIPSNEVILGGLTNSDSSDNWYVVAKSGEEQIVSVDLNPNKFGHCYDSFWDRHGIVGSCSVISFNFSEFLRQAVDTAGLDLYWLSKGFIPLGDAYD